MSDVEIAVIVGAILGSLITNIAYIIRRKTDV